MDYLTSYNVSLCSVTTTEVFNHTETDMIETELCSLGQFKVEWLGIHPQQVSYGAKIFYRTAIYPFMETWQWLFAFLVLYLTWQTFWC